MQGIFIKALTYTPPVILGRQLLSFAPFHGLLLEAADCHYLTAGTKTFGDMILGIWICSYSFADGYLGVMEHSAVRAWSRQCKRLKISTLKKAAEEFAAYIEVGLERPQFWEKEAKKSCRAPIWWLLASFGVLQLGMSEQEAWDCPVAKFWCYIACRNEMEGEENLLTDEENKFLAGGEKV